MKTLQETMMEYKKQMEKGIIQKAYRGLMGYMMNLRTHFKNSYPALHVSGNIYEGYMDMSYFPLFPESLKKRNLKIAIVFLHREFRFEAWLAGFNKKVQQEYLKLFKEKMWNKFKLASTMVGTDYIVQTTLVTNPDFNDLNTLTGKIEESAVSFINDIEDFLSNHQ